MKQETTDHDPRPKRTATPFATRMWVAWNGRRGGGGVKHLDGAVRERLLLPAAHGVVQVVLVVEVAGELQAVVGEGEMDTAGPEVAAARGPGGGAGEEDDVAHARGRDVPVQRRLRRVIHGRSGAGTSNGRT